jgi:queuine tRNA-ribosyltransferase
MLGPILASIHNVTFLVGLMRGAREAVAAGRYASYREEALRRWRRG